MRNGKENKDMFKHEKRTAADIRVPDPDDAIAAAPMAKKAPGPLKCALLAVRDWAAYYAIMTALCIALAPFLGDFVNMALILAQIPVAYLIGRKLMKARPEGTVHKIPRKQKWLLALAYAAVIVPSKIAFHDLALVATDAYGAGPVGYFLVLVLLAPVSEELLYRGVLFPMAERRAGFWPAALMNALVFALAHFPNVGNMLSSVASTLVACTLQSKTGRTRYGIMAHIIFNVLNIPLAILDPSLPTAAGVAAIVLATGAQLLFCLKRDDVAKKLVPSLA